MAKRQLPSPEDLRQLLRYEPETGKLFWKERPLSAFDSVRSANSWNARFAGKPALSGINHAGYKAGRIGPRGILAHRAIWALVHGRWPDQEIDHVNGDRVDNRLENIREASRAENARNRGVKEKVGQTGYKGVQPYRNGRFVANIKANGRFIYLGIFNEARQAAAAYDAAARRYHGEFARTNFR